MSEARRAFGGYIEGAFERECGSSQRAFVKVLSEKCDAVGYAAGRIEFRKRF